MTAAFAIEMSGWGSGTPVLHPIAYADAREKGRAVIAPGWLVRAALEGSREAGAPLGVGDPWLSWLYQPAVRTFRVRLYGDDLSFLQAGHPALFAADSSFSAFYPDYHKPSDTADKLDAAALARMGRSVLGVVRALERVPRGPTEEPHWFAAFGRVVGWPWLLGLGAASLLPGLWRGWRTGGLALAVRLVQSMLAGVFLWLRAGAGPVAPARPAPRSCRGAGPGGRSSWPSPPPPACSRSALRPGGGEAVNGVWLAPWEIAVAALALALAFAFVSLGGGGRKTASRKPSGRKRR